jgi:hypothetical protein
VASKQDEARRLGLGMVRLEGALTESFEYSHLSAVPYRRKVDQGVSTEHDSNARNSENSTIVILLHTDNLICTVRTKS